MDGSFLAVGECMMEVAPAGDGLHRLGFAGDTFNTAWAVRRFLPASAAVGYLTAVGRDWASDEMLSFMEAGGIDTSRIVRDDARSVGLYAIRLDAGGERSFSYWRRDSAATGLAADPERLAVAMAASSMIFFSGITLAILPKEGRANLFAALRSVREGGVTIAFDPNFRPRLWPEIGEARMSLEAAMQLSTVVLPTFDDEAALWGDRSPEETADRLSAAGVAEAVIKNGASPALLLDAGARSAVPAVEGVSPVDTTGAGDAFNGAYLASRLRGLAPADAAARGHSAAALAIQTRGALLPLDAAGRI